MAIKKLESTLINQIAAGEVVDSPYSIVKELIENSIDAKSTKIHLHVYNGGKSRIFIKDNGSGMNSDDLINSFERFATSKIKNLKDLNSINTLGFRGEALPSISSISTLIISSKHVNEDAHSLYLEYGQKGKIKPSTLNEGTEIDITNIFNNVPARKKFLKSDSYEYRKILTVFKNFLVSYPEIEFKLYHNEKSIYNLSSTNLKNRLIDVFGSDIKENLIEVSYKKEDIDIYGYIGNLNLLKKRRGNQLIFLNNRYIKNKLIDITIYNSYRYLVERGEFPFYTLFVEMNPSSYDINVHPKKLEVKFSNELQIQHCLKIALAKELKKIKKVIPDFYQQTKFDDNDYTINIPFSNNTSDESDSMSSKISSVMNETGEYDQIAIDKKTWQIHNKYIITEITSGLIIIDQHVAHERVLYETAIKAIEGDGLNSQKILFPQTISFTSEEFEHLLNILIYLKKIGFDLREFGNSEIIIEGVPSELPIGREKDIINDILDNYIEHKKINSSFIDYIAATYACKAAIKAGDKLSDLECSELLDQLFNTEHPYYCPHGRPIIINLTINDLDKRFERH